MRTVSRGFLACVSCLVWVTASVAEPPQAPTRLPAGEALGVPGIQVPTVPVLPEAEPAGLSKGSRPERLTWERVYALALVRVRAGAGGGRVAEALDPKTLAEQATRYGIADFGRFRQDFLAGLPGAGRGFH